MTKRAVREVALDELPLCHVANVELCLGCEVGAWGSLVQTERGECVMLSSMHAHDVSLGQAGVKSH